MAIMHDYGCFNKFWVFVSFCEHYIKTPRKILFYLLLLDIISSLKNIAHKYGSQQA
jgi:hypothetical protein